MKRTLRTATRFIAISAFTRDEMARELGIAADRVDVVHLAPSPEFRPIGAEEARAVLARYDLLDQSYILSISTLEPRKNFDRLLAAYLALPDAIRQRTPLVIAGGKGWGRVLHRPDAERAVAAGQLRLPGHVPDSDLVTLTARCGVFAYVSLYEGFGLPVIEAMATGAPVLASATTATGETAGNAALLVDPLDDRAIQAGLLQLLESADDRCRWAARSLERAAGFSWCGTVDRMISTWRRAASQTG
jgi:alpha-1,3-rhamnosyl/mannosyltransferase